MTPEESIADELASAAGKRIARQVRIDLQHMTEVRGFGDDSTLRNVWEELCVQLQSEEGFGFAAYEETVRAIIEGCVQELPRHVVTALWLQTRAADDWRNQDGYTRFEQDGRLPICEDDVVRYVLTEYVYPLGTDWSNTRIRDFLDRTGSMG